MNPFRSVHNDDGFLMDFLHVQFGYKWNSVQNMHLIIFHSRFHSMRSHVYTSRRKSQILRQTTERRKKTTVKYLWWWSDELRIDSDRPSTSTSRQMDIQTREREREKKSRAREHSCDRKKAMEFFMKNFDKKKYLKLLPKNEFRKPTKMPLSK